ncbi:Hypothetical predicted protein [Paramuricea clavata]|uniref:Uncharacterized protein n=1 Tax=Paramuricea clavata TaxID=317549 RepID=A0A6S7FF42_PARCT|nr:Hypothetical predicted protein [Paramuricea clavata]
MAQYVEDETKFWIEMSNKLMCVSTQVFALEEIKHFELIKPEHWIGTREQQQYLFEQIVARYLWKHVYECMPKEYTGCPSPRLLMVWENNFTNDIATGWGSMVKTFLKCISVFGVKHPEGIFCQKTIPELLKMKYHLHGINAGSKRKIVDERYRQVYELVDLVYFKSAECMTKNYFNEKSH